MQPILSLLSHLSFPEDVRQITEALTRATHFRLT
jgi:hypothetical protein